MDEITRTDAYKWLLGEIENDAKNVLNCLATESVENIRYSQGKLYGLTLAGDLLRDPFRRLDKAADALAAENK